MTWGRWLAASVLCPALLPTGLAQGAPVASVLRIACEGDAVDAEVQIDGVFKGQCPVDVPVPEGTVQVRVSKPVDALRERVFVQTLRLAVGTAKRLDVELGAPQPNARGREVEAERAAAAQREAQAAAARASEARVQAERAAAALQAQAERGDVCAMLALARAFENGQGVPRDPAQTHAWTARAAATGDAEALFRLGRQQRFGFGTPKDPAAALATQMKAVQAGHPNAAGQVAAAHLLGEGVPVDVEAARTWALRGGSGTDGAAAMALHHVLRRDASSKGGREAAEAAAFQFGIALRAGHRGARLADALQNLERSPDASIATITALTLPGPDGEPAIAQAMLRWGEVFEEGEFGRPKDLVQARQRYQRSADAGSPRGTHLLAAKYKEGKGGLPKDEARALQLYQRTADLGHAFSMLVIGSSYAYGYMGQTIDRKQAIAWYRKGIAAGEERTGEAWLKQLNPGFFE